MMCWSNPVTGSAEGLIAQTRASFHKRGPGLSELSVHHSGAAHSTPVLFIKVQ